MKPKRPIAQTAAPLVPAQRQLPLLEAAARDCLACDLGPAATQTVFGEGPKDARLMLVGEQPGDAEDRAGRPFVGPAGRVLDEALRDAGIDRGQVYVTNAVKHFSFEYRGKRRLHAKPQVRHVRACYPWLEAELQTVSAPIVVWLGATAAQALLGASFAFTKQRGQSFPHPSGKRVLATYHPSAVLRAPDDDARKRTFAALVEDLKRALALAVPDDEDSGRSE
jgi:uracil-DNA glycosylase family protein